MSESTQKKLLFDEKLNALFRPVANTAFTAVDELRSVVIVYDFYDKLNDAPGVSKGLWLSADGNDPRPPDAIVGSMLNTLQCVAHMLDDAFHLCEEKKQELVEVSRQLLEKRKELSDAERSTAGAPQKA